MDRLKLYTVIYVVLFVLATGQVFVEEAGFAYWTGLALIMVVSTFKAIVVAGWYQHLRWEPRSLTYLMLVGVAAALALTFAASYSIT